jgi:putative intracellular protease/amidase
MLQMVSWFSDPGQLVFDPCAGAATTLQAARLLGRDAFGCELDPEWAAAGAARLAGALSPADAREAAAFVDSQRAEALACLALPRAVHKETGAFVDEQTRARAQRRLDDAERVAGKIAALAA